MPDICSGRLAKADSRHRPGDREMAADKSSSLTVRLLVPGASTGTSELLGLHLAVVGNEECAVVGDEGLLELVLAVLVDVLLVVCNLRRVSIYWRLVGLSFRGRDVQSTWQWLDGWRRPARRDHHRRRGRGCRRWL